MLFIQLCTCVCCSLQILMYYIYVCVSVCMHIYCYTYIQYIFITYVCACIYTLLYMYMHKYTNVFIHACGFMYMYGKSRCQYLKSSWITLYCSFKLIFITSIYSFLCEQYVRGNFQKMVLSSHVSPRKSISDYESWQVADPQC